MSSTRVAMLFAACMGAGVALVAATSPDRHLLHSLEQHVEAVPQSVVDYEYAIPSMLLEMGIVEGGTLGLMEEIGEANCDFGKCNSTRQYQADDEHSLLEVSTSTEKVHGYCEICVRMMQMYQRGLPDVCSGLTDTFFISCVKNLESLLKADRAVVYWHQVGCIHMDEGPEIVKPCPAHTICGWVPNIFARRIGVTGQIGQLAPLCPRDVNFLPRVPRTLAPGGLPGN